MRDTWDTPSMTLQTLFMSHRTHKPVLREETYFDHGEIPVRFYPFLEVYQREWNLFFINLATLQRVGLVRLTCQSCTCGGLG